MFQGASLLGYADLTRIPAESRQGLPYGIAIAVAIQPEIIRNIADGPTLEYYHEYTRLNQFLDELDESAAKFLISHGFKAFPKVRSSVKADDKNYRTELPHKTVATRAGLGWIGKCALLVTKEYGSAVRISSVLTNAPLEPAISINKSHCGNCTACQQICPAGAISGKNWSPETDRDQLYNAIECRKTARSRTAKIGVQESLCGLCILACPNTQSYLHKK